MANISNISNGESGASVRSKLNQAITEANKVDDKADSSELANLVSETELNQALDTKVDKVPGKGLSTEDYTTAEKNKLDGIQAEATANESDAFLLDRQNHTGEQAISTVTGLQAALDDKVDAEEGKGLSTNDYTTEEKEKLAGLESSRFKGQYASLEALELAHPTAEAGDYANVDEGVGQDVVRYVWDTSDEEWIKQLGKSSLLTPSQIKEEYESNPDTNAFTDDDKSKLDGIEDEATKNDSIQSVPGLEEDLQLKQEEIDFLNRRANRSVGLLTVPTITENANSVNLTESLAFLCGCPEYTPESRGDVRTVPAAEIDIPQDNIGYYITARFDGENAFYERSETRPDLTVPNQCPVALVIKTGPVYHIFQADAVGIALPSKIEELLVARDGFRKVKGLSLTVAGRVATVAAGAASFGANIKDLTEAVSDVDNIRFYTWNGSEYVFSSTTMLNNTQFNGPAGLETMQNNRFNIQYIFRGVETQKHIYSFLSRAQYTSVADALAAPMPTPPQIVLDHAVFIGAVVYLRDATSPASVVQSNGGTSLVAAASSHNQLGGIQGGTLTERFHLTEAQRDKLVGLNVTESATDTTAGRLLKVGDFGVGSNQAPIDDADEFKRRFDIRTIDNLSPFGGGINGRAVLLELPGSVGNNRGTQLAMRQMSSASPVQAAIRARLDDGSATPWQELWHTGNLEKTESPTDATSGRVLQVGDFGLGGRNTNLADTDLDTVFDTGFYTTISTTPNSPIATTGTLQVIQRAFNAGPRVTQIFNTIQSASPDNIPRQFVRIGTGSATEGAITNWTEWQEIYNAATLPVTQSAIDATTGRLTKVGDFGVGALNSTAVPTENLDLPSEYSTGGFWRLNSSMANNPFGNGGMMILGRTSIRHYHLGFAEGGNSISFREVNPNNNALQPWREVYHTGNLGESDTAVKEELTLANGWTGRVRYFRRGGTVIVTVDQLNGTSATSSTLFVLPSGYRPISGVVTWAGDGNESSSVNKVVVQVDGSVILLGTRGTDHSFSSCYPALP